MNGPPTGPPTGFPPAPPPPSSAPMPEPVEPRKSGLSKWILAGAVVFLVCFGLGLGLVLGGDDDSSDAEDAASTDTVADEEDEPETTEPPATTTPDDPDDEPFGEGDSLEDMLDNLPEGWEDLLPDGMLDDLSDLGNLDDFELPEGMSSVQISVVFAPDARDRDLDAVETAFDESELVTFVQLISADEVSEITGMTLPEGFEFDTLTAFGSADADPDDTRDFACSFADDPGVETVQVFGADPCGTTT